MRITPNNITKLLPGELFVFGSNGKGAHLGGAARIAVEKFGAVNGQARGLQGRSYAINTMDGIYEIKDAVDVFIRFATQHKENTFLVTELGCGIAGYKPEDIAPLFERAREVNNIHLPESFWKIIN